jgi:Tol biopolymer transport system component
LGLIDVNSSQIEALPAFGDTAHLNPQWSPDGNRLYFIASPDGSPNCFRLTLFDCEIVQLTNLTTGHDRDCRLQSGAVGVCTDGSSRIQRL